MTDTDQLGAAIRDFETTMPGWWWSVGHCQLSRDASCGPDHRVLGAEHPYCNDKCLDAGFHDDNPGTLADALRCVMAQALDAISEFESERAAP